MENVKLNIRSLAHGGSGIGTPVGEEGPVWFVGGTIPGEVVTAEVEHQAKRFIRGRLLRVLEESPVRVTPPCEVAESCGGCTWQHIEPQRHAELKRDIVVDQLRRVVEPSLVHLAFSGASVGYRRRVRMHYARPADGDLVLGFVGERSHTIVDTHRCLVLEPALDQALQRLRRVADLLPPRGQAFGVTDGARSVLGLPGVKPEPERLERLERVLGGSLVGIELRGGRHTGVVGQGRLDIDGQPGLPPLRIGPFGFSQAQSQGNMALVKHVTRAAHAEGKRVLELYAGVGNFTRALARFAQRVWASDRDAEAVESLRGLAKATGLPINAKRQNAAHLLERLDDRNVRYDVVVLDPPRAGLGEDASRHAGRIAGERLVYVSCDPATLARDLAAATQFGLRVARVDVFDLMPMTPQVEMVATLVRGPA